MAKTFGVQDAVSGKTVIDDSGETKRMTYDEARTMVANIRHYENTDYFIIEVDF